MFESNTSNLPLVRPSAQDLINDRYPNCTPAGFSPANLGNQSAALPPSVNASAPPLPQRQQAAAGGSSNATFQNAGHRVLNFCVRGWASDAWVDTLAVWIHNSSHEIQTADLVVVETAVNDVEELIKFYQRCVCGLCCFFLCAVVCVQVHHLQAAFGSVVLLCCMR